MSDIAIKVENLGKKYTIGHQAENGRYVALRDVLVHNAKSLLNKTKDLISGKPIIQGDTIEEVWALKDVSFEVQKGEPIGIIGRNGAGKSTLLKVLSRITEPSTGRVTIRGRVVSLLEVGTGFNPELTGRENIYLNGTILGMTIKEIKRKFDEIVSFAEVERYLDTPVKRYSSGMYIRLAFAVAAHLEPEILVVDEVLAVGDAQFQEKCLGKMGEVAKGGRTVLFVSHNMGAIKELCRRSILLDAGSIIADDSSEIVIGKYLSYGGLNTGEVVDDNYPKNGQKVKIKKIKLINCSHKVCSVFELGEKIILLMEFDVLISGKGYNINFELFDNFGNCIFSTSTMDTMPEQFLQKFWETGKYRASIELPSNILRAGNYHIRLVSTIPRIEVLDVFPHELKFTILDVCSPVLKTGEGRRGIIMPILPWSLERIE